MENLDNQDCDFLKFVLDFYIEKTNKIINYWGENHYEDYKEICSKKQDYDIMVNNIVKSCKDNVKKAEDLKNIIKNY